MTTRDGNSSGDCPGWTPTHWVEVFDTNHNAIWRYVCRRCGPTAADDLAGEVFLRALRSQHLPSVGAERAWLYGIATNLLRERSRKEARRLRAYARLAGEARTAAPDLDAIASRIDAAVMLPVVARELARLEPTDRETILLYALTELDYNDIAIATNVPVGTVRSRLHRARGRLRRALGEPELTAPDAGGSTPTGQSNVGPAAATPRARTV